MSQLAVIGDVHGNAVALEKALEASIGQYETIILVGDYVDWGPESRGVLDLLVWARDQSRNLVLLRGNHDQALLDFLDGGSFADYAALGGLNTIASYGTPTSGRIHEHFVESFPDAHRALLESTKPFWESQQTLISHAGFDPARLRDRSPSSMYMRSHSEIFDHLGPWPARLVVVGHYLQLGGQPLVRERLAAIDTGSGRLPHAPLTLFRTEDRSFTQYWRE